ncbi:terpenoid cyclases/Protein prenyltransferase, partial [Hyphopichia burtonii NRRL Y-1933]
MTGFLKDKHVQYVKDLDSSMTQQTYEYWLLEHLRMNGLYWGVVALVSCKRLEELPVEEVIKFILSCYDEKRGGFGAFPQHDAHILSTLSAIQILSIYERLEEIEDKRGEIVGYIKSLQLSNGSFKGDEFGEVDTRFVYTSVSALSILGELSEEIKELASSFIMKCENFDGGFGMLPGAESHAAQVFTCIGTLAICNRLDKIENKNRLCNWLSERQVLPSGGFNGRPEKLPDVCYSWWVLSSLSIIGSIKWINDEYLEKFILSCQDEINGGLSDRPENQTDVYHTCFGIAGLSLLNYEKYDLIEIDPVYCMPKYITNKF